MRRRSRAGVGLLAAPVLGLGLVPLTAATAAAVPGSDSAVFINELHYDNTGGDTGEFVEVAGPAGTDLTGWSLVFYNGNGGAGYGTIQLSGQIADQANDYGTVAVDGPSSGIQNGAPDGVALVAPGGRLVQFLSYEGTFTATNGPADGETSTDIGVSQSGTEPVGSALQLTGEGSWYGDFAWVETERSNTRGEPNTAQTFTGEGEPPEPPDEPEEPAEPCGDPDADVVLISDIQGSGDTFREACAGTQTVEAVVTAVKPGLNGFYLQEEAADSDGDAATSEGIFVYDPSDSPVEVGDLVRVTATVAEYESSGSSQTQLSRPSDITVLGTADVAPTPVTFPVDDFEPYEGMLVELVDELVISEYFNYDRYGEVVLAKPPNGWDRLYTPTAVVDPGAEAQALLAEYQRRIITLDDYNSSQNPETIPHPGNGEPFSATNTFRGGDTVTGVQGVIDETFGRYRIQPTQYGDYSAENPRPTEAPDVGGSVQVASFNVLNYFLTIDEGPDVCGAGRDMDCRGADSEEEFQRQRAKILAALVELDADVVGLMEMENTPGVEPAADLVEGLNEILGEGTYDYIDTGVVGTDAIRLGMLYKPGVVQPVGDVAILDSADDPRFDDQRSRPMLTQTFDEVATGARFTVSVNHLKSKGSACDDGSVVTDGQGNCNVTRTLAAEAIVDYLAGDPTGSGDPDHLIIGDLNAYDREDPIRVLLDAGYTDLIRLFGGEFAYGYVFDGMVGYLDHALASPSLTPQVTGAAEWHINADEPDILDYNLDFGRPADYWTADPYRSSDHDAVLVGLDLTPATPEQCYADGAQTVRSYIPGQRANGTDVPPGHRDASQAIGTAGGDDGGPSWVTLGLGGELVLEFANPVQNTNGTEADLRVVDVHDGGKGGADAARVLASTDGETWVDLGTVTGTGTVDLGELSAARYVTVVDATPADGADGPGRGKGGGGVNPATDGYDLDAVEVLTGCDA